ncbi:VanZ family protein [Exiguobacterium alkaliphilum]|uniref:VanZ family protein n=1 Tax=Exiguobacterium alkaliphilum TaxID=1428684 RepID=UPI001BA4CF6C|nr:VanZ family protein [Exiguobacterium alkaliphilum]QUE85984.1 VanZ family protein [Exiguobacterium alkaliphilum]
MYIAIPVFTLIGIIGWGIYFLIDLYKHRFTNLWRRAFIHSSIVYMIVVVHLTIGYLQFPAQTLMIDRVQFVPFRFVYDWYMASMHGSWFFWNSVKLTTYNFLLLIPLGVYLTSLYKLRPRRGLVLVILTTIVIELTQLVLTEFGFLYRGFNVDDLLLNSLGGWFGLWIGSVILNKTRAIEHKRKAA